MFLYKSGLLRTFGLDELYEPVDLLVEHHLGHPAVVGEGASERVVTNKIVIEGIVETCML